MTNDELIRAGARLFNPLPGSRIGERGYLGARIQPNSPSSPGSTALWFQSIYALYIETGQGADFTNGQSVPVSSSRYITAPSGTEWGQGGAVDHSASGRLASGALTFYIIMIFFILPQGHAHKR